VPVRAEKSVVVVVMANLREGLVEMSTTRVAQNDDVSTIEGMMDA
jgi:hypothetical protein